MELTKEMFNGKYPMGLSKQIVAFDKALYQIMTTDEIDKVINSCDEPSEIKWLKEFKKTYLKYAKTWETFPIWIVVNQMESLELFKDIISIMITNSKEVYRGEDLD